MTKKFLTALVLTVAIMGIVSLNAFATETTVASNEALAAAINAAQNGDTIIMAEGTYNPVNLSGKNITLCGTVAQDGTLLSEISGGNPALTVHNFNGTVKDLKITNAFKSAYGEPAGNITFDNIDITGGTYGFHLIAYQDNITWNILNCDMDISWANSLSNYQCGHPTINIINNIFKSTSPYYPDYGAPLVNTFSPNTTVEGNVFGENTKIYIRTEEAAENIIIGNNYYADGVENAFLEDSDSYKTPIESCYADETKQEIIYAPIEVVGKNSYFSIQAAIDVASANDTILVDAGTYSAFSIPDDKDGLTIKAADENNKPIISINDVNNGGIQYHASDLTFENLIFNIEETCADATTWNVSALGYYYEIVKDRNGLLVTGCDFINNSDIEMSAIAANLSEYTVTNCSFKNFATGVHSFMDGGILDNVTITNNTYENVEKLVNVYYGGEADGASSLTISDNTAISGTTEILIDDYARINDIATTAFDTLTVTNNDATIVLHNYTTDSFTAVVENNSAKVYNYRTEEVLNALAASAPNGLVYVAYDDEENEKKYVVRNGVAEVYIPKSPSKRPITNKLPATTGSVTDNTDKPEQPADTSKTQIILTIGKTEASVFGELKANDVAPKLVNDRTMLPARFVAESLGATVTWTETEPNKVLITKDDIEIIIYIGSDKAYVNGEEITLDSPAFLENDRTYTPIRFISEELGADVKWNDELQQVIITKK